MDFRHAADPRHAVPPHVETLVRIILDCAFEVHTELGPGLLESVYQEALAIALRQRGIPVMTEVGYRIVFRGQTMAKRLRVDVLAGDEVIIEIKNDRVILPVHVAQLRTYLRIADKRVGLILNFSEPYLRDGIRRVVHTRS